MEPTTFVRRALWANVAFAEVGALLAFFAGNTWEPINELTGGQGILMGIELLVLAGMATWAALRKPFNKRLVQVVITLNALLLTYLVFRFETTPSLSALGAELVLIDSVVVTLLIVAQGVGLRNASQRVATGQKPQPVA